MLRRLLFAAFLLGLGVGHAQDSLVLDSLRRQLALHPQPDSARFHYLGLIWQNYLTNQTDSSLSYARLIMRESGRNADPQYQALGHRLLGVSHQYLGQADSALHHYRHAARLYRALGNTHQEGVAVHNSAILHHGAGRVDSTEYYLNRADSLFANTELPRPRAAIYELKSNIARDRGNASQAVEYSIKAYEFARAAEDSSRMADAEIAIAKGHIDLREPEVAIPYFESARGIYRRLHDNYYEAVALLDLMETYREMDAYDTALAYGEEAEAIIREQDYGFLLTDLLLERGYVYEATKEYGLAERSLREGAALAAATGADQMYSLLLAQLACVQVAQPGKERLAYDNGLQALEMAKEQESLLLQSFTYDYLARAATTLGRPAEAVEFLRGKLAVDDSLYNKDLAQTVANLTYAFEKEQQELIIKEQENRLAVLDARARIATLQNRLLWVGVLLLIVLAGLIYYVLRQRVRRQREARRQLARRVKEQGQALSTHALQMARKGELLQTVTEELDRIRGERPGDRKRLTALAHELHSEERSNQDWNNFRSYFQGVHHDFEDRLRRSADGKLTPREIRLASLIKMQLNNQEIGSILGLTQPSLYKAKYRLRKKLPEAGERELDDYLQSL